MGKELSTEAYHLIIDFEIAVRRNEIESTEETIADYKQTLSALIDYIASIEPDDDDDETIFEKMMKLAKDEQSGNA